MKYIFIALMRGLAGCVTGSKELRNFRTWRDETVWLRRAGKTTSMYRTRWGCSRVVHTHTYTRAVHTRVHICAREQLSVSHGGSDLSVPPLWLDVYSRTHVRVLALHRLRFSRVVHNIYVCTRYPMWSRYTSRIVISVASFCRLVSFWGVQKKFF